MTGGAVMADAIQQFDFAVLDLIQQHIRCDFLDAVIPVLTHLGIAVWIVLAIVFIITRRYRLCGISMGAGMLTGLLVGNLILKNLLQRERPCWINDTVQMLIAIPDDYSFPSGHTLASFISAIVIFRHDKRIGIPALVLASLMAFTRLYLYVHFPTDIIFGIALAAAVAIPIDIVVRKYIPATK